MSDKAHFQSSLSEHRHYLLSCATVRLGDAEAARDIVQETLLAAWKNRANYRGEASYRTWLTAILKNKINDHIRCLIRQRELMHEIEIKTALDINSHNNLWLRHLPEQKDAPETALHNLQLNNILIFYINKLPEIQRRLFLRSELDYQDTTSISQSYGITSSHAYVLLHRARKKLKEDINDHYSNNKTCNNQLSTSTHLTMKEKYYGTP